MSPRRYEAASVRQLAAVVDRLEASESPVRMRQLRMVVGMWDRAVIRHEMGDRTLRRAQQFFTRPVLSVFWDLAAAGELRHWDKDVGKPLPVPTLRIVRDCLAIMARRVVPDRRVWLPAVPRGDAGDTVGEGGAAALYRGLVDLAGAGPLEYGGAVLAHEDRARLLAMVAIILDTAARSGELAALRLDDVTSGEAAVGVRRQQQKGPSQRVDELAALAEVHPSAVEQILWGRPEQRSEAVRQRVLAAIEELGPAAEVEWYALREGSQVAVRRWLRVREGVVEALPVEGGRGALWVTLWPSKAGPAGVTISAQGLRQAYARGVAALNAVMAGQYGWVPLPIRMEPLRRSVTVTPLEGPPG